MQTETKAEIVRVEGGYMVVTFESPCGSFCVHTVLGPDPNYPNMLILVGSMMGSHEVDPRHAVKWAMEAKERK